MWKGCEPTKFVVGDKLPVPIPLYLVKVTMDKDDAILDPRSVLPPGEEYPWGGVAITSCTLSECIGPTGETPPGTQAYLLWFDGPGQTAYNAKWIRYYTVKTIPLDWYMYQPVLPDCPIKIIMHDRGPGWAILEIRPWE